MTMTTNRSRFRRAQSKFWFESDQPRQDLFRLYDNNNHDQHNDIHSEPSSLEHISTISSPESESESNKSESIIETGFYHSPGSLRSHDSGFSDSDSSPQTQNPSKTQSPKTPTTSTPYRSSLKRATPLTSRITPPTVIRRKKSSTTDNNSTLNIITNKRISFSAPNSPTLKEKNEFMNFNVNEVNDDNNEMISLINLQQQHEKTNQSKTIYNSLGGDENDEVSSMNEKSIISSSSKTPPPYNNETVVFGTGDEDHNYSSNHNEKVNNTVSPLKDQTADSKNIFDNDCCSTSTPKQQQQLSNKRRRSKSADFKINKNRLQHQTKLIGQIKYQSIEDILDLTATELNWDTCTYIEYDNPLLNGHAAPVHFWLDELRKSYCHEVLSTLQTKSLATIAADCVLATGTSSKRLNSQIAGKCIRQLQLKSIMLQTEFENLEEILASAGILELNYQIPRMIKHLQTNTLEFIKKLRFKRILLCDSVNDKNLYKSYMENIVEICSDLSSLIETSLVEQMIEPQQTLLANVQILKHYVTLIVKMCYKKFIQIIVDRLDVMAPRDQESSELILRSNLSLICMLTKTDYIGIGSLREAFLDCGMFRVLLGICIEPNVKSTQRILALRALAAICSTKDAIKEFETIGGTEILFEMITDVDSYVFKDPLQLRECLTVFTQITAPWHGRDHTLIGLRTAVENLVERITKLIEITNCEQTFLLAVAALNNLSSMETTSIYSIMSHESPVKIIRAICKDRLESSCTAIFSHEQLFQLLQKMASNKRCHQHLTDNREILNFIINMFLRKCYEKSNVPAEQNAINRTIRCILKILTKLELLDSNLISSQSSSCSSLFGSNKDLFDQSSLPILSKIIIEHIKTPIDGSPIYNAKDVKHIVRKLRQHYQSNSGINSTIVSSSITNATKSDVLESNV